MRLLPPLLWALIFSALCASSAACSTTAHPNDGGGDADGDGDVEGDADGDVDEEGDVDDDADADRDGDIEGDADSRRSRRILFVGNSYTASNALHEIVGALLEERGEEVFSAAVTPGGYRLEQHAADADGTHGDTRLRQLLVTGEEATLGWDVVVLQQQSQIPGFPVAQELWIAMEQGARTLRDLAADVGATTVLFMTWGYRDGDPMNPTMYADYPTMQDGISDGYTELARRLTEDEHRVAIAPVGEAYRAIWAPAGEGETFPSLYSGDGSHPSIRGSYLAACVFFATLTSSSPGGLTYRPSGIDDSLGSELQEVAADVVLASESPESWRL